MKFKHLFYIITFFTCFQNSFAQFGIKERDFLNNKKQNEVISLIVKGDIDLIKASCAQLDANLKYFSKNIAAVDIQKSKINEFYNSLGKSSIEIPVAKAHLLMDTAIIHNNILQVHNGLSPLSQAYTGENVIIGILDSGIYFDHEDFKNPDGTTRIKFIWDQNVNNPTNPPAPYNYGNEWSWIDIDNGSCNHVEPTSQNGHGTTVAGAAAGNGRATGTNTGVAPKSEIIAVAVDYYGSDFLSKSLDAIDYVFKKADALGKPCVINTSFGTYNGAHDGRDLTTQLIDALIEEKPGRILVSSAGNGNNIDTTNANFIPAHLSYTLSSDTNFTWFKVIPGVNKMYFDLWSDTSNFKNAHFSIGLDSTGSFTNIDATDFLSIDDYVGDLTQGVYLTKFFNDNNSNNVGKVETYLEETEGRYHLEVLVTPLFNQTLASLNLTGEGTFDIWSSKTFHNTSDMLINNLPPNFVLPKVDFYKYPDNRKSIVAKWNCSDKVISVGNFANRATYFDVDSVFRQTNLTPGEIYYKSSEGPTRDNRIKPDISATGNITFATGNQTIINLAMNVDKSYIAPGGKHYRNGGTSIASPIVAGAAALYLEKNPNAWWYEIKEAITQTAKRDTFTGPTENNVYGYGKLDGFEMMQFEAVLGCTDNTMFNYNPNANTDDGSCVPFIYGCTDSNSINFNANANTDDGSCIAIVYGCTDSTAFNYDSTANTDNGSCVPIIYGCTDTNSVNFNPNANTDDGSCLNVGINDVEEVRFSITPNPASNFIQIKSNINEAYTLSIANILGQTIFENSFENNKIQIDVKNFNTGIYFVSLKKDNEILSSQKLIIK